MTDQTARLDALSKDVAVLMGQKVGLIVMVEALIIAFPKEQAKDLRLALRARHEVGGELTRPCGASQHRD